MTEARNLLLEELQWVHGMLRQDLETCRQLASLVAQGAPAAEAQSVLRQMRVHSPLFQLRVSCLQYCRFVHGHHGHEDVLLFPAVRRSAPELAEVVDRLEADHRRVSDLLDQVEESALGLDDDSDSSSRKALVEALHQLSDHLLEHLAFEEQSLAPVLASWGRWPMFGA